MDAENFILSTFQQTKIVQSLGEKLKAYYVFPEMADQICNHLNGHLENGDYADITVGDFFAYALTIHMQEITHDEHIWIRWHPEQLPKVNSSLSDDQAWIADQKQAAENENFGFHNVHRMAGNIGYLDIHKFHNAEWGGKTAAAAMNYLVNTQALIIDLRKCTGGHSSMVALISSYLFGGQPVHLNSIYWHEEDATQEYWTDPDTAYLHFDEKPVYVLISNETFSAGEEFAYNLKNLKRATLVGENTGGGAHPGASYRIHPHFEVFIPVGRAINPITKSNWEGSGVHPDVSVSAEKALHTAYRMALESIIANISKTPTIAQRVLLEEAILALEDIESQLKFTSPNSKT